MQSTIRLLVVFFSLFVFHRQYDLNCYGPNFVPNRCLRICLYAVLYVTSIRDNFSWHLTSVHIQYGFDDFLINLSPWWSCTVSLPFELMAYRQLVHTIECDDESEIILPSNFLSLGSVTSSIDIVMYVRLSWPVYRTDCVNSLCRKCSRITSSCSTLAHSASYSETIESDDNIRIDPSETLFQRKKEENSGTYLAWRCRWGWATFRGRRAHWRSSSQFPWRR